jgi:hypothetical protein
MVNCHFVMAVRSCHNVVHIAYTVGEDVSIFVMVGGPCDGRE